MDSLDEILYSYSVKFVYSMPFLHKCVYFAYYLKNGIQEVGGLVVPISSKGSEALGFHDF